MDSSASVLSTSQESKRSKTTQNREFSCDEICTVTSSTENNETRDTEMDSSNEGDMDGRNNDLIAQPCTSTSIKPVSSLQPSHSKGEPCKTEKTEPLETH